MGNLTRTCLLLLVVAVLGGNAATTTKRTTTTKRGITTKLGVNPVNKPTTKPVAKIAPAAATTISAIVPSKESPLQQLLDGTLVGRVAVPIKDFPYQLSLRVSGSHICGATIISADWAVTAAQCCKAPASQMTLMAGSADRTSNLPVYQVSKIIIHESYDSISHDYDIALLKVSRPFATLKGSVELIPLADEAVTIPDDTSSVISGWGTTSVGSSIYPLQLQAASVPIYNNIMCGIVYSYLKLNTTNQMICAGPTSGEKDSTCQGDTGGPMVAKLGDVKQLIGITSWRFNCAYPKIPGVYTSVPALRSWIKKFTN